MKIIKYIFAIRYLTKLWNERNTEKASITHLPQWEQDYFLPPSEGTMFWEYLEVGMYLIRTSLCRMWGKGNQTMKCSECPSICNLQKQFFHSQADHAGGSLFWF